MIKYWAISWGRVGQWVLAIFLVLAGLSVVAQPTPPGETETDRVLKAHRQIDSAQVDVRFTQYFSYPDETEFAIAEYRLLFDRKGKRLRVDRPGYTLVCDGTDVLLTAEALPGRHLRMPLEGKFTYERLIEIFPDLAEPVPPALVMLMSESPVGQLSGGQTDQLTRIAPGHTLPNPSTYLSLPQPQGSGQLVVDSKSRRLESMLAEIDVQALAGSGVDAVRLHYGIKWSKVGEPVDDAQFKLDLKQSQEMTTLVAFLSPNGGNAQPGPGGQGGGVAAGATLLGMPLPEIELDVLGKDEKIKLSELDKGVVVLEYFATWSKSSVLDLPALAEFKAWCKEKKHEVRVYGVAVGEQPDHMTNWMAALEKTAKKKVDLPILLDTSTEAAMAMKLPTVPRTLIVVDGRVVEVYGGVKPKYLDDLKEGLPEWLEKVKPAEEDLE
jgi:hypothetical protein